MLRGLGERLMRHANAKIPTGSDRLCIAVGVICALCWLHFRTGKASMGRLPLLGAARDEASFKAHTRRGPWH